MRRRCAGRVPSPAGAISLMIAVGAARAAVTIVALGCNTVRSGYAALAAPSGRPYTRGMERSSPLAALALVSTLAACGGTAVAPQPKQAGDVAEGVVRLAEGATLPRYPDVRSELQPEIPESCTPASEADRTPVRVGEGRGLEGVLVQASEFGVEIPHEPTEHEVVIEDCRLTPRLLPAVRGDTLVVRNDTDYPFLPTFGRSPMMQAILPHETRSFPLQEGGVHTLQCAFAAPCGRTDVIVVYHPLHTVTDENGHFRLKGLPRDRSMEIHAWHPLFEDAMVRVTTNGAMSPVELTLVPLTPPEGPPDAGVDAGVDSGLRSEDRPGLF